jgi:hypothetical protein
MKTDSLDINGSFKVERLSSLPTWDPSYIGRVVYNTTDNKLYVGKSTGWAEAGSASYPIRPDWDSYGDNVAEVITLNKIYPNIIQHSGGQYIRVTPWDLISAIRGGGEPISYNIKLSTGSYGVASEDPTVPYVELDDRYCNKLAYVYVKITNSFASSSESYTIVALQDLNAIRPLTWDALNSNSNITLSEGRLLATNTNDGTYHRSYANAYGVGFITANEKFYWEITIVSSGNMRVGLAYNRGILTPDQYIGEDWNSWGYDAATGNKYNNATGTAYGNSYTTGDVIGVAWNATNGKLWFSKNGVWQASGDPAADTNPAYTGIATFMSLYPAISLNGSSAIRVNFGATAFAYTPPTGFTKRLT